MKNSKRTHTQVEATDQEERREFLKKVGKTSAAVPAAALLLAASQNKALANGVASGAGCTTCGGSGSGDC
jgi:hypothetical protein